MNDGKFLRVQNRLIRMYIYKNRHRKMTDDALCTEWIENYAEYIRLLYEIKRKD
jgi:hypothetical protein